MPVSLMLCAVASLLIGALVPPNAYADIYTWTDASGNVNVSNVAPPDGVRPSKVVRASPTAKEGTDAARVAQLEALSERVRELEQQVQRPSIPPPPDLVYPTLAPMPRYAPAYSAPPTPYNVDEPVASGPYGCDPSWPSCWASWMGPIYPGLVVVDGSKGHHGHSSRGNHRNGGARPGHGRRG